MSTPPEGKTPGKTPAVRVQSHGGALRTGNVGNRGGPGRPPSKLRSICRQMAGRRLSILGEISSKKSKASNADKIRAVDVLLRYGMGDGSINVADVRSCLREQSEILYERLDADTANALNAAFREIWAKL